MAESKSVLKRKEIQKQPSDKVKLNRMAKAVNELSEGQLDASVATRGEGYLVLLNGSFAIAFEGDFNQTLCYFSGVRDSLLSQKYG